MKKKSSNLTASEMQAVGWANRTPAQRREHLAAMGRASAAAQTPEQLAERGRKGAMARIRNIEAKKLAESKRKKQRKTPGK